MKKYLKKLTPMHVVIAAVILILALISTFIGIGYAGIIVVFGLLYWVANQSSKEKLESPKAKEVRMNELRAEIEHLQADYDLIKEHVEQNPSDLEAKFMLRDLERKLEEKKNDLISE
jgi:flagellar biosynthesis component FlhA